jgi:two-component system chemotaxis response regulator CheY
MARVLIVDDAVYFRVKMKQMIERLGHEVVGEASDGMKAAAMYSQLLPDIVTMDISMPNTNGIESVEMIIDRHPRAKIVMVSALGQKNLVLEAMQKGAKHFIVKPFQIEVLGKVLSQVLTYQK